MLYSDLETILANLLRELKENPLVRKVKVSPLFYHTLCSVIDQVPCESFYGLDVVEDPSVETYELLR